MSIVAQKKPSLAETHPELAKQWSSRNGFSPYDVSPGSSKKVHWVCPEGHEWVTTITSRSGPRHRGCPYCSNQRVLSGFNDLATINPQLATEWSTRNILKPSETLPSTKRNVWWVCEKGHEWEDSLNHRSAGRGCPYCSSHRVLTGYNDLATLRPDLAKEWSVRNTLLPQEVMVSSNIKVWWRCAEGHEWVAGINNRSYKKRGCPYCVNKKVLRGYNDLNTLRPDLAAQWASKNTLSPYEVTVSSKRKIWWLCNKGHEWATYVYSRAAGSGCPYCSGRYVVVGVTDLASVNPELTLEWSPQNKITPQEVSAGSDKKVWWRCVEGHEWLSGIRNRVAGCGCPYCSSKGVSKIEINLLESMVGIYEILPQHTIKYDTKRRPMHVDGFFKYGGLKFILEYDGWYWHINKTQKDVDKTNILLSKNYHVIRIRENPLDILPLENEDLFQIRFDYTRDHRNLPAVVEQIKDFVEERTKICGNL